MSNTVTCPIFYRLVIYSVITMSSLSPKPPHYAPCISLKFPKFFPHCFQFIHFFLAVHFNSFSHPLRCHLTQPSTKQQAAAGPDLQAFSASSKYVLKYWSRRPNRRNLWAQVAGLYWGVNSNLDVLGFSQNTHLELFRPQLYLSLEWANKLQKYMWGNRKAVCLSLGNQRKMLSLYSAVFAYTQGISQGIKKGETTLFRIYLHLLSPWKLQLLLWGKH